MRRFTRPGTELPVVPKAVIPGIEVLFIPIVLIHMPGKHPQDIQHFLSINYSFPALPEPCFII
jgi:hypothetical protein